MAEQLKANAALFDGETNTFLGKLIDEGQDHLFSGWPGSGTQDEDKKRLVEQLRSIDKTTQGGLLEYIRRAKKLLDESKRGVNPLDGYTPSVPSGKSLDFGSDEFIALEDKGVVEAGRSVFVLVAGGLGERLGYSGIKIALPCETVRNVSFLQVYIESILAIQQQTRLKEGKLDLTLPFVIMTSDDTHDRTVKFLEENKNFGMSNDQIYLMKQEKVACLSDSQARIALEKDDPYKVETKPHGHGDIHSLINSSGLMPTWLSKGLKWLCIFQDTNALLFNGIFAALGVSESENFDMNSLTVPRKAKEAIGAVARLTHTDGSAITCNVEYNQLDPLLRATINKEGDVNAENGFSPFPGNVNQLVFKLETYAAQLEKTGGLIEEFVNPKYKDESKNEFQKSTRLECMMQDYPKTLPSDASVGFTTINQVWATYSPVKNAVDAAQKKMADGCPPHSAQQAEADLYMANCKKLSQLGIQVGEPETFVINGMETEMYPRVSMTPMFGMSFSLLKEKFPYPSNVVIKKGSVVVLDGAGLVVESLEVDGAVIVKSDSMEFIKDKKVVTISVLATKNPLNKVQNKGWKLTPIEGQDYPEETKIRGFIFEKLEQEEI